MVNVYIAFIDCQQKLVLSLESFPKRQLCNYNYLSNFVSFKIKKDKEAEEKEEMEEEKKRNMKQNSV